MRLDEKARENLEAAERLLPDDAGRDGLPNAATSRSYYAAYLAVADGALRAGLPFSDSSRTYFRHELRTKADYLEDQVDLEEASLAFDAATRLVNRLLGEAR